MAFVSGAASGIGFGLARVLASRGVRVAMSDVRREALDSACARLAAEGADVAPFVLDVADRAAFYATADAVEQRFGKVHYVFNGIKAFVPKLRQHGEGGHVVNVSSMAALVPDPGWHQGLYAATKMAITALSLDLRRSLAGTGIEVSILYPGLVRTDIAENLGALRPLAYDKPPEAAAEIVLRGMERRAPLIVTHPQMWPVVAEHHDRVREAFEAAA